MDIPKIKSVSVMDARNLLVLFSNGRIKKYNISQLLEKATFSKLSNFTFFKNIYVEPGGYAVAWDSNTDISEYELWKNGEDVEQEMERGTGLKRNEEMEQQQLEMERGYFRGYF